MLKKRLVSGIKPTGELTLGNYLGAIKNFVKLQNEYETMVFIADLHSLTIDIEPENLRQNTDKIIRIFLASGLDANKVILFKQSDVPQHAELGWILENQTTIGELSRMTQYKDKALENKQNNKTDKIKTGLLTYPSLMAADILLYNADIVPVGLDQKQHLELTRNIGQRFNNRFGKTFTIPDFFTQDSSQKIMSLSNPIKKMSKSSKSVNSYISLFDSPEIAKKKIMKAVTDSENKVYLSDQKPGVKNLIHIFASLSDTTKEEAEKNLQNLNYKEFKEKIGNLISKTLIDLQSKIKNYSEEQIQTILKNGKNKASIIAKKQMEIIKQKIGLK